MDAPSTRADCPACGADLPPGARFCPSCGTAVNGLAAPSQGLRGVHPNSERRIVTTLFADVVNSTALAEGMDAERWAAIMNEAFERLTPAITRYGGTLARLMGDALLAFFGAPIAHEDDPARAVRAALDLIEAARLYATTIQARDGVTFAVRVGVSTGQAVLGEVGTELIHEYAAMGDAPNIAARLQAAAPPMGILIAEPTYRMVADFFDCIDRGTLRVKGKADGVRGFEVRSAKSAAQRLGGASAGARGLRAPLVGREAELRDLTACLERLASGQGGIVGIIGEPGVGKSRLLAEARHRLARRGLLWLEGHTLSFGEMISYWPFLEMLRRYAGIGEEDSEGARWSKLEQRLGEVFGDEAPEMLRYLATLLAIEVPADLAERVKYLDGEAIHRQLFRVVRRLFEQLARQRPLVLVLEDVHWMDQSSAELLEHLLPLVRDFPILVCGVSRPERHVSTLRLREVATQLFADRYTEITVAPLSPADSDELLAHLLVVDDRSAPMREVIRHKAEGNPFYVEEVVRSLVQQGASPGKRTQADGGSTRVSTR